MIFLNSPHVDPPLHSLLLIYHSTPYPTKTSLPGHKGLIIHPSIYLVQEQQDSCSLHPPGSWMFSHIITLEPDSWVFKRRCWYCPLLSLLEHRQLQIQLTQKIEGCRLFWILFPFDEVVEFGPSRCNMLPLMGRGGKIGFKQTFREVLWRTGDTWYSRSNRV